MFRQLVLTGLCVSILSGVFAAIPLQINHQGLVKVSGTPFNGNGDFRFAIVDPDSGNNLWTNDNTNVPGPGMPAAAVNLPVVNGIYNVRLGDTTLPNMTALPSTAFDDSNVVLRIWFNDGSHGNQQLAPDHKLTSAGYAFHALYAESAGTATTAGTSSHASTADTATSASAATSAASAAVANYSADADKLDGKHASEILSGSGITGEVRMWGGSIAAIPSGWLFCNGQAVSRTTYADLFAAIGTIYGTGDGSTTFNLPDFRDRSPMGAKQDDAGVPKSNASGVLAQSGGEAAHTLAENEMPKHHHGIYRGYSGSTGGDSAYVFAERWSSAHQMDGSSPSWWERSSQVPGGVECDQYLIKENGNSQPHNNLHPYFAISFIIKY